MNAVVMQNQLPGMPEPANILDVIARAANDPNTDVAKMEKLLEMFERISARQSEVAFNTAMRSAQEEMPKILRNKENSQTHSRYADLESVNQVIVPVYTKHGFSLSFGTADCPIEGHARITCLVSHIGGHSRPYQADIPLDLAGAKGNANKTGVQGFGSTMSYGRRYVTLLVFNITLTNEDTDGNALANCINASQVADLEALITEVKADRLRFLRFLKITKLEDIPAANYSAVVKMLETKRSRS